MNATDNSKNPILHGTFMQEILHFSGILREVSASQTTLMREESFGEMNEMEKILFTLSNQKMEKVKEITKSICGSDFENVSGKEHAKYRKIFSEKVTLEQKTEIKKLECESENMGKIMWAMIKLRIPEANEPPSLLLKPGYKIVGGIDLDRVMEEMLGGGIAGIMVKMS